MIRNDGKRAVDACKLVIDEAEASWLSFAL